MRNGYEHLRLVSMRPSLIKYNVLFTMEEIVLNAAQMEDGKNIRE